MSKTTAVTLLIVFGNLIILFLGTAQILLLPLLRQPLLWLAAVTALIALHTAAVTLSRKRFKRLYGVSARRYMLLGAVPAAALCVLVFAAINVLMYGFGVRRFLLWSIDMLPLESILSPFALGYSAIFLLIQFVVIAREIW